MNSKQILLDSNILVYSFDKGSLYYPSCSQIRQKAVEGDISACISPQNINETFRVLTDPKAVKNPFSPSVLKKELQKIIQAIKLLPIPIETTVKCLSLSQKYNIKSLQIYDVFLVATMLENGVKNIVTLNQKDFIKFQEITVLSPSKI